MSANAKYWVGMVASVLTAIAGQAEVIPEPYRHIVSLLGIVGTAISGYMIQRPLPSEQKD
jgi:hypothetical protein